MGCLHVVGKAYACEQLAGLGVGGEGERFRDLREPPRFGDVRIRGVECLDYH